METLSTGRRAALAAAGLVAAAAGVWFCGRLRETPPMVVLAVLGPTLVWIALVRVADGRERQPAGRVAVAVLAGALGAAWLALLANDAVGAWLGTDAQGRMLVGVLGGPVVEEVAKGLAVLAVLGLWPMAGGLRDGVVVGALVGFGFAFSENLTYFPLAMVQGGPVGLARAVYLRGVVEGPNHAVFTATVGAALGWATRAHPQRTRVAAVGLGGLLAVVQHAVWNGLVSERVTTLVCNASAPGGACGEAPTLPDLLVTIPAWVLSCVAPAGITLIALARRRPTDGAVGDAAI